VTDLRKLLLSLIPNSPEFKDHAPNCEAVAPQISRRINMKKLTLSLWLALAAAGILAVQALPSSNHTQKDLPFPTCPPDCPGH
jgi:hypothetical protein